LVNIEWSSIKSEGSDQIPAAQSGDARKAAEIALTMVEDYPNNHHPDERRYQALYALINGGHTEMLKRIVENPKIFKKWREEARTYLKQARR
jgi:hypothetical protein